MCARFPADRDAADPYWYSPFGWQGTGETPPAPSPPVLSGTGRQCPALHSRRPVPSSCFAGRSGCPASCESFIGAAVSSLSSPTTLKPSRATPGTAATNAGPPLGHRVGWPRRPAWRSLPCTRRIASEFSAYHNESGDDPLCVRSRCSSSRT